MKFQPAHYQSLLIDNNINEVIIERVTYGMGDGKQWTVTQQQWDSRPRPKDGDYHAKIEDWHKKAQRLV